MAPATPRPKSRKSLYPTLNGGRNRMSAEEVASHQRERLEGAMLEAVSQHGYPSTTVSELVGLAGVSKSDFYNHFESKASCFLATFDGIVAVSAERVSGAYRDPGDFRDRLLASLTEFVALVVEEPGAASFAAVDSLSLGAVGAAHRQRGSEAFELLFRQTFDHSPSPHPVSDLTVRAIVAGIRGVVYRALRAGHEGDLTGQEERLVDWALAYQGEEPASLRRAMAAAALVPESPRPEGPAVDWSEPPDSPLSREQLSQRERIVRAAARVVVDLGYEKLSIPKISAAAGTSNQTFYEHFRSKQDAFFAAFEALGAESLQHAATAFGAAASRPEAVGAGFRAMLEYVAGNELFARLAFFELPTAGPEALDRADAVMDLFAAQFGPPQGSDDDLFPALLMDAISSGIWEVIQYEITHGRLATLPDQAPEITRIALATTR